MTRMQLNPYLSFSGNARQALEFYQQVFGGDLRINTFSEFGTTDPKYANLVMHGILKTPEGMVLMASDIPEGMPEAPPEMPELKVGNNVTISLSGSDRDALMRCWEKLSSSGKVQMPMGKQIWGDEYGSCIDQFGINWGINITGS